MTIKRIIENIISLTGSSDYDFPFSLKNLNFFTAIKEAWREFSDLSGRAILGKSKTHINGVMVYMDSEML
ncbi:hypothetical protein [Ferroplasma acidiphilum]|uniref:hypothetical protein n=1 Tax=Ferroplasma acidiphilum TaxID=74969 RepID=UPI002815D612|nr:hypothetical protein [Ferroplasma acidiphilum]WMT53764.1 MAG: hypothetical protein RE473_02690 [Ferroplasma acidiphilum]